MLYPTVSDFVNSQNQSRVMANYDRDVVRLAPEDYTKELEAAHIYNQYIAGFSNISASAKAEEKNEDSLYRSLLNISGNGVMGMIEIPSIYVSLPIYHTTEDVVLQVGAGHFVGSSLPVGGKGTHAMLTGHRGLPSAKLFTDLDQLKLDDVFYIKILNEKLAYQVDQIEVVLPEEMDHLRVDSDQDYVTLVTCTPYGINSHRMLIRGTRIPYVEDSKETMGSPIATFVETTKGIDKLPLYLAGAIILITVLCTYAVKRNASKKKRNKDSQNSMNQESEKDNTREV